ncbi:hypothetical protein FNF27_07755 [Cafeteria roenbergensis]|uniref:Uncharacterized protein n=1 Tax=Cafeteria roenbergensis TaxID=33653 RepID=A0A5A8DJJ6_CAFRO|nr:hypothetical protein FNF27_07755 [Cafeteria roenbergensis]
MSMCYAFVAARGHNGVDMAELTKSQRRKLADQSRSDFVAGVVGQGLQRDMGVSESVARFAGGVVIGMLQSEVEDAVFEAVAPSQLKADLDDSFNTLMNEIGATKVAESGNSVSQRMASAFVKGAAPEIHEAVTANTEGAPREAVEAQSKSRALVKKIGVGIAKAAVNTGISIALNALLPGVTLIASASAKLAQLAAEGHLNSHNDFKDCMACLATAPADVLVKLFPNAQFPPVLCGMEITDYLGEAHSAPSTGFLQEQARAFAEAAQGDDLEMPDVLAETAQVADSAADIVIATVLKAILQSFVADHATLIRNIRRARSLSSGNYVAMLQEGFPFSGTDESEETSTEMIQEAFRAQLKRADNFWDGIEIGRMLDTNDIATALSVTSSGGVWRQSSQRWKGFVTVQQLLEFARQHSPRGSPDAGLGHKLQSLTLLPSHIVDRIGQLPLTGFCSRAKKSSEEGVVLSYLPVLALASKSLQADSRLVDVGHADNSDEPLWLATNLRSFAQRRLPILANPVRHHRNLYVPIEQNANEADETGEPRPIRARIGFVSRTGKIQLERRGKRKVQVYDKHKTLEDRFGQQTITATELSKIAHNHPDIARAFLLEDLVRLLAATAPVGGGDDSGSIPDMAALCRVFGANLAGTVSKYAEPVDKMLLRVPPRRQVVEE